MKRIKLEKKLITSIIPKSLSEFDEQLKQCETTTVEHRIDGLKSLHTYDIKYSKYDFEFIATLRSNEFGGYYNGSILKKVQVLKKAIQNGVSFIDIEFELEDDLIKELMSYVKEFGAKIILSSHNFKETPSIEYLREMYKKMEFFRPDIIKIVTFAQTVNDGNRMVQIQKESTIPTISFAMGEIGSFTRIKAILEGAPYMYISLKNKTAPGQFSLDEFKSKMLDYE